MEDGRRLGSDEAAGSSRFELAPPRRFILPAVLLLLSEGPGYGYALVPRLQEFRFGHVDRPAVYRALAQLERDGLVEASSESPTAGQARRVYRVTPLGSRVLRVWMGVIKEEQDYLGQVLRRYQATSTADAVLAAVEGGWATTLGLGWSPVSSTSSSHRRLVAVGSDWDTSVPGGDTATIDGAAAFEGAGTLTEDAGDAGDARDARDGGDAGDGPHGDGGTPGPRRFRLVADRSVVLIEVRSTVGPLSFGAIGVSGAVEAAVVKGMVCTDSPPSARIVIRMSELSSGNSLYDAELLRRIDARRFPTATVELGDCAPIGQGNRYRLQGQLTFHGVTRPAQGTVIVEAVSDSRLVITGEQVFDIRDFAIPSPTVLMLRIYPDVRVRLHAEAELEEE
jgi:PadR family transcriptional regulator PadR